MNIKEFVKRHSLLTFFILAFAISWGGVLILVGPGGISGTPEQFEMLFYIVLLAMLAGPPVAGLLLTGLIYGKAGLREFLSRLIRWRMGARWYVVALLTSPFLAMATLFALLPTSPVFLPGIFTTDDKTTFLLIGIAVGLAAGFFEELGWTGFAVPEMRLRYGLLTTGLIMGFLWGAWHLLMPVERFQVAIFFYVGVLPAYRVLMVWVYDRTGSLLVAMLMHASLTASVAMIFMPQAIPSVPLITWYLVLTAALWIIVAAVAVTNGGQRLERASRLA